MSPAAKPPAATTSASTPGASSTPIAVTTKAVAPGLMIITPTPSSTVPTASGGKGFVPLSPTTGVFGSGSAAAGSSPATATIGTLFGAPTTSKAAATGQLFGAPSTSTTPGTTTGDLFESPATTSTCASGGLFGPPATTTSTSGGLFGAPATTTTTSGGFFGKPATLSTGGLFGTPTAVPGSLFGAVSAANNHASILGAPSTNTTTGEKFGPPTTSRSQTAHSALSLTFRLIWPVSATKGDEGHKVLIKTKDGSFEFICTVREVFRLVLGFTADDPDQFRRLGMFKGAVIQDMQKVSTVYTPLTQIGFTYTLSVPFRKEFLVLKDGVYEVEITLTNQTTTIVQTNPAYHCETLLERLLQDSASHDVFFEFEVTEDASSLSTLTKWLLPRSEEKQSSEESDTETDEKTAVGGQKDASKGKDVSSSKASQSAMPALDSIENVSNPTIKGKQFSRTVTVGAHSSVLSQYKYFQSTYFSPAIDRSAEKTVIKMLEDEVAVFRLLLQFLYLGQLKPRTVPLFVTRDTIDSVGVPTWEDVFLTAHRYEVPELAALAADKIVANLDRKWAIHFLFRTGYKFANLRHNVIHFVVANNMPQVVQKELQQTYLTHPECSAVFGEIMTELWNRTFVLIPKVCHIDAFYAFYDYYHDCAYTRLWTQESDLCGWVNFSRHNCSIRVLERACRPNHVHDSPADSHPKIG
ncbi:hypothetical protein BG000_006149 [Podila horticola]|nr:hypothetical protein BG000_006149 [Podila horticola]